jgi:hypothetical protein
MAAREVIYFPFGAQLSTPPQFPALLPPEPAAKSPPQSEENLRHVSAAAGLCVLVVQERLQKTEREEP